MKRRRVTQVVKVVVQHDYPKVDLCPFCNRQYDERVTFITATGCDHAYMHYDDEDEATAHYPMQHMVHTDADYDGFCMYETGGEHEVSTDR